MLTPREGVFITDVTDAIEKSRKIKKKKKESFFNGFDDANCSGVVRMEVTLRGLRKERAGKNWKEYKKLLLQSLTMNENREMS